MTADNRPSGRKLTTYHMVIGAPQSVVEAVGHQRHQVQVRAMVAAKSGAAARRALDALRYHVTATEWKNHAGTLDDSHPDAGPCLAEPGVVFVQSIQGGPRREPIRWLDALKVSP